MASSPAGSPKPAPSASSRSTSGSFIVRDKLALVIASILLSASALSWAASYLLMPAMMTMPQNSMNAMSGVAAIAASLSPSSVAFFELVWTIGMAAMMFPAMIPVVLFYNKIATKAERNPAVAKVVGTPLFLSGYLIVYALLGVGAYLAVFGAVNIPSTLPLVSTLSIVAPSAVLALAGAYQLTSLKTKCVSGCVSPMGFFALHSHRGLVGSLRMGLAHGAYCVGCCWAYMLVMLAVGAMSIPIMVILTGVIVVEKVLVRGSLWFTRIVGLAFFLMAILVFVHPAILAAL
jgi:predicted metal-binding membrane protein